MGAELSIGHPSTIGRDRTKQSRWILFRSRLLVTSQFQPSRSLPFDAGLLLATRKPHLIYGRNYPLKEIVADVRAAGTCEPV